MGRKQGGGRSLGDEENFRGNRASVPAKNGSFKNSYLSLRLTKLETG